jgi:O-methyltransferase involved in polyketide biosynthesis
MPQVSIAIRTEILDITTKSFMNKYPDSVIINLGCGLDTRFSRLDNGKILWYDLDLPEPIRIRRQFFHETDRYKMISRSVFDYSWMYDIETDNHVLIIAEGLLMYFKENEVKNLINKLGDEFKMPEMLLEVTTPTLVDKSRDQGREFREKPLSSGESKTGKKWRN